MVGAALGVLALVRTLQHRSHVAPGRHYSVRPFSPSVLIALCLLVLPAVAGGVALTRGWISSAGAGASAQQLPAARIEVKKGLAGRCPHCGRIHSKRRLGPAAADPSGAPSYEYTVSMADGSSRVFREQMPVSWRVGARLYYVDGGRAD